MRRRHVGKDGYESSSASDSNSAAQSFWMTHKQQCSASELVALLKSYLLPEPAPERPYVHPSQYTKPEHVRVYSDEMDKDYQPSPWTLAFAALTLGLYIGVPHILLGLLIFSCWSRAALVALLVLLGTLLLPAGPLRMQSVLSSYLFLAWRRYFHFSFVFEEKLDCYKDYIIAQYPHGAFPLACLVGGSFMATEFPEYHCYAMAASSAFYVPIWRHVHAWLGTAPCTKNNFHKLLGLGVNGPLHHQQHQQQKGHEQQKHASATSCAEPAAAASATSKDALSDVAEGPAEVCVPAGKQITASPFATAVKPASVASAGGVAAGLEQQPPPRQPHPHHHQQLHGRLSHLGSQRSSAKGAHSLSLYEQQLLHQKSLFSLSLASSITAGMRHHHTLSDADSSSEDSDCESFTGSHMSLSCISLGATDSARHSEQEAHDGSTTCSSGHSSPCSSCGAPKHYPLVTITSRTSSRLGKEPAAAAAATSTTDDKQQQQQQHPELRHLLTPEADCVTQQKKPQDSMPQDAQQQDPAAAGSGAAAYPRCRMDPYSGRRKIGVSVGLMIGGIAEMFMIRPDHERIKVKDRKGFVRIAVEHGTDILPVYMFGANQVLNFGPAWLQRFSRRMRASVGIIYGLWGLPVPRRVPIFMATGRALVVGPPMSKDHPDFQARVDEVHGEYMREIERVYYDHRGKYGRGFENRPLVLC